MSSTDPKKHNGGCKERTIEKDRQVRSDTEVCKNRLRIEKAMNELYRLLEQCYVSSLNLRKVRQLEVLITEFEISCIMASAKSDQDAVESALKRGLDSDQDV